jgi:hypothetical protein
MGRLRRFPDKRFIGVRDRMVVYDCDDDLQFEELQQRIEEDDLLGRALLSSVSPDTLAEARNRGFAPR